MEMRHARELDGRRGAAPFGSAGIAEREVAHAGAPTDGAPPRDGRFGRVVTRLTREVGADRVRKYLGERPTLRVRDDVVEVCVPNRTAAELLNRGVGDGLRRAIADEFDGAGVRVRVRAPEPATPAPEPEHRARSAEPAARAPRERRAMRTLESFVVGGSNRLAHAAAVRVAEASVQDAFAPFVVHGGCGMGKTHLLEGIADHARRVRPGLRVRMTTGDAFTTAFVDAVRHGGSIEAFHKTHRRVDLLCVDDAHFLAGREATQNELLHTLEALRSVGSRVVLATDAHPLEVAKLNEALTSRMISGLVVRIDAPGADLRRELIARGAAKRGMTLEPGAVDMLVERTERGGTGRSPREIEGVLAQVHAVWSLARGSRGPVAVADVERAVTLRSPDRGATARGPIPLDRVVRRVCDEVGVEPNDLFGRGRARRVVLARSLAVLVARRVSGASYPEIGRAMARGNHSTVITQMKTIEGRIAKGETVRAASVLDGLSYAEAADRVERAVRHGS